MKWLFLMFAFSWTVVMILAKVNNQDATADLHGIGSVLSLGIFWILDKLPGGE